MKPLRLPRWLLGGRQAPRRADAGWDLSTPLLQWSPNDEWTIGNAVEGTLITGGTGSGKTSGSGRAIALAFLNAGFGGLVCLSKADERAQWEEYCRESGRLDDLRVVGPDASLRFNVLDAEYNRKGVGAGQTESVVNLCSILLDVVNRNPASGGGREEEGFWRQSTRSLVRNCVDLLALAKGRITVPDLYRVAISAPTSMAQKASPEWRARSLCFQCLNEAYMQPMSERQHADFELVVDYFTLLWPTLAEKTRSVILASFVSMIEALNRGLLRDLFCADTNITPGATTEGRVILIDIPVKEFNEIGQVAQILWKAAFQREIERRNVTENGRPVFLWADEFQNVATAYDAVFQATCRSSRVATVYLTQNLSGVYAALGGQEKGRTEATALFGNFSTKIMHSNSDPTTTEWNATLIGRSRQCMASGNTSRSNEDSLASVFGLDAFAQPTNTSAGFSEVFEHEVQPGAFTQLRTGGPANDWEVDCIVFMNGRRFRASGKTWLPVTFEQKQHGAKRR